MPETVGWDGGRIKDVKLQLGLSQAALTHLHTMFPHFNGTVIDCPPQIGWIVISQEFRSKTVVHSGRCWRNSSEISMSPISMCGEVGDRSSAPVSSAVRRLPKLTMDLVGAESAAACDNASYACGVTITCPRVKHGIDKVR